MEGQIDYYKRPEISNSDLTYFNQNGAKAFYLNYKERGVNKLNTSSVELGSLIHCIMLEPDTFNDKYIVPKCKIPQGMMKVFIDTYYTQTVLGIDPKIALEYAYEQSDFKWSFGTVCKKFVSKENQTYLRLLEHSTGKQLIDQNVSKKANDIVNTIAQYDVVRKWFYTNEDNCHNEIEIYANLWGLECKAKLDRIVFTGHEVHILDIKTTQNNTYNGFIESIKKYRYDRQMAFYRRMIHITRNKGDQPLGYQQENTIKCKIFAINTNYPYSVNIFDFSDETLNKAIDEIQIDIEVLKNRFANKDWFTYYDSYEV